MKKLRTVSLLVLMVIMMFSVVEAADDLTVGISFQQMNNPYFIVMKEAFVSAVESIGADYIITDAHHDVAKQVSDIEDMIQRGIDILIINPTDTAGVQAAVELAKAKGIVVIAVDADAAGPRDAYISSENYDAGYQAGKFMAEELNGRGQVAILNGIPADGILDRVNGFKDAISGYPDIAIVDNQNGKQERSTAMTVTENMLQANPDLDAIFSVNDTGGLGCYSAILGSGRNTFMVSIDGHPEAVDAILDGDIFRATVAQFPRDLIRMALGTSLAKYWGAERVPEDIRVPVKLIDTNTATGFSW